MSIMSTRRIRHKMIVSEFKKMGAKVVEVQGLSVLVKFVFDKIKISFQYRIMEDNRYFLERLKPYALNISAFNTEEEVLEWIKEDIMQFKNAMQSHNFEKFIKVNQHMSTLKRLFEDLFLYYNLEEGDVDKLDQMLYDMLDNIKEFKEHSKRAYVSKDPEILRDNVCFAENEDDPESKRVMY